MLVLAGRNLLASFYLDPASRVPNIQTSASSSFVTRWRSRLVQSKYSAVTVKKPDIRYASAALYRLQAFGV